MNTVQTAHSSETKQDVPDSADIAAASAAATVSVDDMPKQVTASSENKTEEATTAPSKEMAAPVGSSLDANGDTLGGGSGTGGNGGTEPGANEEVFVG
jgi:hypothetical protein